MLSFSNIISTERPLQQDSFSQSIFCFSDRVVSHSRKSHFSKLSSSQQGQSVRSRPAISATELDGETVSLYIALLFAVIEAVAIFVQPISTDLGIQISRLGFLYAGFRFLSAAASYYIELIRDFLGISGWLYTIPFVLGGFYVGAWFLPLMILPAFFLMDATVRITRSFAAQYINDNIERVNRATLLSAASMMYAAVQIPFIAAAGSLADTYTRFGAVAIFGAILIGGAVFLFIIETPITTKGIE